MLPKNQIKFLLFYCFFFSNTLSLEVGIRNLKPWAFCPNENFSGSLNQIENELYGFDIEIFLYNSLIINQKFCF